MTVINFIFPKHENLPEVKHYIDFYSNLGIKCYCNCEPTKLLIEKSERYVEWHIMGTHFYNKPRVLSKTNNNTILIHEYASLSTGNYYFVKLIKDYFKRRFSHIPDYQLFLNEYIQKKMSVLGVPYEIRDMGVSKEFIESRCEKNNVTPLTSFEFDFAYVGSMAAERRIENFLSSEIMRDKKILLIGTAPDYLLKLYADNDNVIFTGRVEQAHIPQLLQKVQVCVNYIPDVYPYNQQTSTKLIEYLTLGKVVISNKYDWVLRFIEDNELKHEIIDDEYIRIEGGQRFRAVEWTTIISKLKLTSLLKNNESL